MDELNLPLPDEQKTKSKPKIGKRKKNYIKITWRLENLIDNLIYNKGYRKNWDHWYNDTPDVFYRNFYIGTKLVMAPFQANMSKYDIFFIGQSHLDASWLWDKHTCIRRAIITFEKALYHLEKYPHFTFSMTGPQYWDWVKTYRPELLEKIKPYVQSGRFEAVGGDWIEPDIQVVSGESLVRQRLLGMRWYLNNLGQLPRVGVLSDSFGFCWTYPQILAKSGGTYFWTAKMGWNNYNPFPFNYFYWQGPDGSKVLCHNFQANWMGIVKWRDIHLRSRIPKEPGLVFSYANSPEEVEASLTKEYIKAFPIFYGLGDGGMGPLEEEVGMATALARGYHAKFTNMLTFFKRDLEPILKNTPTWNDEMYLELHRGIYTSHAKMKKLNRDAECSLLNAETLSTLATLVDPAALYPTEILDHTWKTTLFNQFHDILPGSSIPEVYLEAEPALAGVIQSGHTIAQTQLRVLGDNAPVGLPDSNVLGSAFVFNPLPWARDDVQEITFYDVPELPADVSLFDALGNEHDVLGISRTGETIKVSARLRSFPAVGGRWVHLVANEKVVPELSWTELPDETYYIATPNYNAKVSKKTGLLISLVLVATGKELLTGPANKVKIYRDFPKKYPAWDINSTYTRRRCPDPVVQSVKLEQLSKSMVRVVVQEQTNHAKTMTQTITFNAGSPCIFLSFDADWTQKYDVVKVAFPLNTDAHFLTGEIPFGNIDRPLKPRNRFEVTKWEFPAFRWVDLSSEDNSGGVAVINNSKYGFSNRGSTIAMTLLRTSKYPYSVLHSFIQRIPSRKYPKHFDLERHHVEYAIFPHADSWRAAEAWRKAIEFNFPCIAPAGPQELPTGNGDQLAGELISGGLIVTVTPNFRVTAIKLPEDAAKLPAKTLIIRGVEVCGNDGPIEIEFHENLQVQDAQEVDLLELNPAPADASGSKIHFNCGKYEIKTFQITLA